MIKLAIAGAAGRTGSAALRLAAGDDRFHVAAALSAPGSADVGETIRLEKHEVKITDAIDGPCDVLIDFTLPAGTMAWLEYCVPRKIPMVIGPTGYTDEQRAVIKTCAQQIPIVQASNFSVGIAAIVGFLGKLASDLGDAYDVEIVETHHRHKVDAPSGTALTLLDAIAEATGRSRDHATFGRHGNVGERQPGEIGIHAVRLGETIGTHQIHFTSGGETIIINHTAHSRDAFAAGTLRAAEWIVRQQAGYYTMAEVLGSDTVNR